MWPCRYKALLFAAVFLSVGLRASADGTLREQAQEAMGKGRYDESLRYYDAYLKRDPHDLDAAVERAQVFAWRGDYAASEKLVRRVLQTEPEHIGANLLHAELASCQGRQSEAQEIYRWVLELDPGNRTARRAHAAASRGPALEWLSFHRADNEGFFLLRSGVGMRFHPLDDLVVRPAVAGALLGGGRISLEAGVGGGIAAGLSLAEGLRLEGEANAIAYPELARLVDWSAGLAVAYAPSGHLELSAGLDTVLFGAVAQSVPAMEAGVRAYRSTGSLHLAAGDFSAFAHLSIGALVISGEGHGEVATVLLDPKFRVAGEDPKLFLGTRHWFTGYSEPAPDSLYWSPPGSFTHQATARLEGSPGERTTFFLEVYAGLGHEWIPGTAGSGEGNGRWDLFPATGGALGLEVEWSETFKTSVQGWIAQTHRSEISYALWSASLTLAYVR